MKKTFLLDGKKLCCGNRFLLFAIFFFYKWKSSLKLVEVHFLGEKLYSSSHKRFFCVVKTVSFYSVHLSCKSRPLLKLVKTSSLTFYEMTVPNIQVKKQCQFGRVLKITVKELICFAFSQQFRYNFTLRLYLSQK